MRKKLFYLILGGILFTTVGVIAETLINSSDVIYTKDGTNTNVEAALDDLYDKASNQIANLQQQLENAVSQEDLEAAQAACPSGKQCLNSADYNALANATPYYIVVPNDMRFAFGTPTDSSPTDYTQVGKNVFIGKSGEQAAVCIIYNNKLECFKNNNYEKELEHVKQVFGESNCSSTGCNDGGFACDFYSDGYVNFYDYGSSARCNLNSDGVDVCWFSQ